MAPHFICIGMQKSGTRWLYEQFRNHPDFWMPPKKELRFFGRAFPSQEAKDRMRPQPDWSEADHAFAKQVWDLPKGDHSLDVYTSLFAHSEGRLTGDITPFYAVLAKNKIARIHAGLPEAKIIMMVRDPVARLWSALNDAVNDGAVSPLHVTDPATIREAMTTRRFNLPSFATKTHERWSNYYDIKVILLDDVIDSPDDVRTDVLNYLGASPLKKTAVTASHNSKAGRPRAEMSSEVRQTLLDILGEELREGARIFGGASKSWLAKYPEVSG